MNETPKGEKVELTMEKNKLNNPIEYLRVTELDSERVAGLSIPTQPPEAFHSLYEEFSIGGIRVDRFQPGFVSCSFTVPPRLTVTNFILTSLTQFIKLTMKRFCFCHVSNIQSCNPIDKTVFGPLGLLKFYNIINFYPFFMY